jgi:hypothetical protein
MTEGSWIKFASHFTLLNDKSLLKSCFQRHFCCCLRRMVLYYYCYYANCFRAITNKLADTIDAQT